jgi:pimeloyl-ACP methyl ester carboxylesterase
VLGCTTPGNAHGVRRPPEVDPILASGDPQRMLPYLVRPAWAEANHAFLAAIEAGMRDRPVPPYARRLHYLASEGHDAWDQLPAIEARTLVIHGSDDQVNVPENARLIADRIPGAELHLIPGARHAYYWDSRPSASDLVLEFLARHPV